MGDNLAELKLGMLHLHWPQKNRYCFENTDYCDNVDHIDIHFGVYSPLSCVMLSGITLMSHLFHESCFVSVIRFSVQARLVCVCMCVHASLVGFMRTMW